MIPSSTYRLQFREGMTFDRAIGLVPHLSSLGISHLYASPVFQATSGSTHGYDIVDANAFDTAIGDLASFERLAHALRQAGIGLILDIVPNHMAASVENPWWRDVLHKGRQSSYAGHFDIDWSEQLTLPVLGKSLSNALAASELQLVRDETDGTVQLAYFDTRLPLAEASIRNLPKGNSLQEALHAISHDPDAMRRLLDAQHWQLLHWKDAAHRLSYRRFFEVVGLVGMRVEDERVFQDTHRLILDLVRSGQVQGLRVDHVDGLADPSGYLDRLRQATGAGTYITVEKILGPGETLPPNWPVSGTTGYEFISALSHLFIDQKGTDRLQAEYHEIDPNNADYEGGLRRAKKRMVERNFAGEVARLLKIAEGFAPELGAEEDLRAALQELIIAFPVYRIYGYRGPLDEQDKAVLRGALEQARSHLHGNKALLFLETLLDGTIDTEAAFAFRVRFQQLTGPVMAKSLEDTLFYRHNRLIAANEVGGEPGAATGGVERFHAEMLERMKIQPNALSTTSTHDTKRGEDARARLYALSEDTTLWAESVKRWRKLNEHILGSAGGMAAPEANVEWMLYQSLAGLWPEHQESPDLETLRDRFTAYAEKAIREAKLRTDWSEQDPDYEKAVATYAAALLSADNGAFLEDFTRTIKPFVEAGYVNTLAQTLIKMTAPGVPDIYQGTEDLDLSLVDPDNRRPVDYTAFEKMDTTSPSDSKHRMLRDVLTWRREHQALFSAGEYYPLPVSGQRKDHVVAFARRLGDEIAVTVVPRLVLHKIDDHSRTIDPGFWVDTAIARPAWMKAPLQDLLSGGSIEEGDLVVSKILADQNVALLTTA